MQEAAQNPNELELDATAELFFSQPPPVWEIEHDEWEPEPLSSLERMAMLTTAAPAMAALAVAITLLFSEPVFGSTVNSVADVQVEDQSTVLEQSTPSAAPSRAPAPELVAAPPLQAPVAALPVRPVAKHEAQRAVIAKSPRAAKAAKVKVGAKAKHARQLLDAGDAPGARDLARAAIRLAPEQAAGYIVLAGALDKLGDRVGMAATFRTCASLATDPLASACKSLARVR